MTNDERQIFGQNLLTLIRQRNWSIRQAAIALHYNRQDLSAITVGRKNFKLETAVKFAKFFNVSLFLLFSRQFRNSDYRNQFPFIETDYMNVIRTNFKNSCVSQASLPLDPTTTSHIMHGRRKNLTISTLIKLSSGKVEFLSELLKTNNDKLKEIKLQEDTE